MTEHFYNGFIKRAQDYGLTVKQASNWWDKYYSKDNVLSEHAWPGTGGTKSKEDFYKKFFEMGYVEGKSDGSGNILLKHKDGTINVWDHETSKIHKVPANSSGKATWNAKHTEPEEDFYKHQLKKNAMHWTKDLTRDIMGGRQYPVSYLTGELAELGEAVKNRDWENFKEEMGDSAYAAQMIAGQRTGLNLPVLGADAVIKKFYDRINNWKQIFDQKGIPFSVDYLKGGSNYAKHEKIQKAFELAGNPVSEHEAKNIASAYTH